ncbi:ankyrin repeat-containing domain protein [Stachybotrys elegans]|uniref:Ankyrin repeat-containing domain protein n=1 Tax=Stachybotrys elegans TaxID=80388 RepID=A0A8K0SUC3_9HYPO|nr:ankyrin repeat-containing domain protein [Stachybotrys elegans]
MTNVVPADSAIMRACQIGDVGKIQELFAKNLASPWDVTPDNLSLLSHAVNMGHTGVVKFLLEQEKKVANSPYGKNQTSPLQWALYQRNLDVTRLLVHYEAKGDYVSSLGWTPAFYLFYPGAPMARNPESTGSIQDFLSIFSDNRTFLDLEFRDPDGETVLQRTILSGSGEDVSSLLALGASTSRSGSEPWKNEWSLMHVAIRAGNTAAVAVLLGLEHFSDIDAEDYLGWTMLQHAARLGYIDIVNLLLKRGSEEIVPDYDPESDPDYDGVLEQDLEDVWEADVDSMYAYLRETRWTAKKYYAYMQALVDQRRTEIRSSEEDGELVDEIFWEANETADA